MSQLLRPPQVPLSGCVPLPSRQRARLRLLPQKLSSVVTGQSPTQQRAARKPAKSLKPHALPGPEAAAADALRDQRGAEIGRDEAREEARSATERADRAAEVRTRAEPAILAAVSASVNASEVYCDPALPGW